MQVIPRHNTKKASVNHPGGEAGIKVGGSCNLATWSPKGSVRGGGGSGTRITWFGHLDRCSLRAADVASVGWVSEGMKVAGCV